MVNANEVKKTLKEAGFDVKKIAVRHDKYSMGSSIRITVKDYSQSADAIAEVASKFAEITRCDYSGEILSGGNRFVFADYDYKADASGHLPAIENEIAKWDFSNTPSHARISSVAGTLIQTEAYKYMSRADAARMIRAALTRAL